MQCVAGCQNRQVPNNSGVETGGSGGSMNRGPQAPGGPRVRGQKNFTQENNRPLLKTVK